MQCAERRALLEEFRAAVERYSQTVTNRESMTFIERIAVSDGQRNECERTRHAFRKHCEEHGC